MRRICLILLVSIVGCLAQVTRAASITGASWVVHYNLPDQKSSAPSTGEYDIRDALLRRIGDLKPGDQAYLATYTFSGNTPANGAAGPILVAVSNALARGAGITFVVDRGVDVTNNFGQGTSLQALATLSSNQLRLVRDNSTNGIMHNKLGLFRYDNTNDWLFVASWNFTGGASINQWNVALELNSPDLFRAYTNEMAEFIAGRFHSSASKSHAHDRSVFRLPGDWGTNWVRFAPYPHATTNNALVDIVDVISNAKHEIVFALNKLTRTSVSAALIAAANRGVMVHGVIPLSDRTSTNDDSYAVFTNLTDRLKYEGANVVNMLLPFDTANGTTNDFGRVDLVHAKYMIIDPWTDEGMVIHGSANWTDSALASTSVNDENVLFIRHSGIARAFYAQFRRMNGMTNEFSPVWFAGARAVSSPPEFAFWPIGTNPVVVEASSQLPNSNAWVAAYTAGPGGRFSLPVTAFTNGAALNYRFRSP